MQIFQPARSSILISWYLQACVSTPHVSSSHFNGYMAPDHDETKSFPKVPLYNMTDIRAMVKGKDEQGLKAEIHMSFSDMKSAESSRIHILIMFFLIVHIDVKLRARASVESANSKEFLR